MKKDDLYFMKMCRDLALKAKGKTSPNPLVGAVVVKKNQVIGKGFHKRAGTAHAEVIALDNAGEKSEGAKLYVTLEPCGHFGRTPPCVHKIIQSGIKEVIVGMLDPNPLNNGKSIHILRQNKIKVKVGLLEEELKKINETFIKYITRREPFVTVKAGQSLDGKIATRTGDSKWITSDRSRQFSRSLRSSFDAIMVGVNTVLRDDPRLDAWFGSGKPALPAGRQPIKIIVDSRLSTPADANIFSKNG
ncbi:MAG: bifunctional diaminohydroxyphosphoribosylaminopyrimidine deaminase/5-amino-6-(5-phosphoribosylamino)uracil reductase RibD, partial [Candidatus Omnitrophica bacterium]|nr:bifunctional diaminohydroxyphosphoribosylaminopyrimidine deaminase/5-amino-6-(5-phosphoribosylamino)uracil reductase RibD [Candidatus Omnitrophota bacterium]